MLVGVEGRDSAGDWPLPESVLTRSHVVGVDHEGSLSVQIVSQWKYSGLCVSDRIFLMTLLRHRSRRIDQMSGCHAKANEHGVAVGDLTKCNIIFIYGPAQLVYWM